MSAPLSSPSRYKFLSKPRPHISSASPSPATKSLSPDFNKPWRSPSLSKPKSVDNAAAAASPVSQLSRPRRPRLTGCVARRNEDVDAAKVLQEKERLIEELQSQVSSLKAELDEVNSLNRELDSRNKKLALDLHQSNEEVRRLKLSSTAKKLNELPIKAPCPPPPPPPARLLPKPAPALTETQSHSSLLPPPRPPPPPPMRAVARKASAPKTPAIVEFYRSLTKQDEKDIRGPGNRLGSTASSVHNSIVGEIQNRSAHLLAIKADVETKGDFINGLIQKVVALACTDIEDVLKFVEWLDDELSALADERAVLKHFNWPERKADAIREAATEYRGLKQLEREVNSFKDDPSIPCGIALKKMAILLDKSEKGIGRLVKLRSSVLRSYQDLKIPTNWLLDSGIASEIKEGSMKLVKMYVKRVKMELDVGRNSDKECNQEALVLQGVQFAYRAHQFAGGLDSETMCAFEEIRKRVPRQLGVGRELSAAVPSS